MAYFTDLDDLNRRKAIYGRWLFSGVRIGIRQIVTNWRVPGDTKYAPCRAHLLGHHDLKSPCSAYRVRTESALCIAPCSLQMRTIRAP